MRTMLFAKVLLLALLLITPVFAEEDGHATDHQEATEQVMDHGAEVQAEGHGDAHSALPPIWLVAPFILLLIMIATGPLFIPISGSIIIRKLPWHLVPS